VVKISHKILSIFIILLFTSSCAYVKVNYVGNSYDPTSKIDLYLNKEDVKKEYKVIGHAEGRGNAHSSSNDIQTELLEEAKYRGADGIIISGINTSSSGNSINVYAVFIKYK
jgi:hypothetical protein